MTEMICIDEQRRESVRVDLRLNGLDYVEVNEDRHILTVFFLGKAPVELDANQVRIEGGRRIRDIKVLDVKVHHIDRVELDDHMVVTVDQVGDFSTYTLRVVQRNAQGGWRPHDDFDPCYHMVDFNFRADCPSDLDCKLDKACPADIPAQPEINYLAKDYDSFRQLILDRMALVMPQWKERHVPDIGIALVEVLAYVGDYLSYYQDAVATEAYLETARQRISVRRHARLVDYRLHEGCNARSWVCIETNGDVTMHSKDLYFITGMNQAFQTMGSIVSEEELGQLSSQTYEIFEPMWPEELQFYGSHSILYFYTWGDRQCCLPKGTTHATLIGRLPEEDPGKPCPGKPEGPDQTDVSQQASATGATAQTSVPVLHLKPGDVLIFQEIIGPQTGHPGDADPRHRHAVRLTSVTACIDPLNQEPVVEIEWHEEDALPFPLCLSSLGPPPQCKILENVSIAYGNVILVDHGQTRTEELEPVPAGEEMECCIAEGLPADPLVAPGYYRPKLTYAPLTFSQPLSPDAAASDMLNQDVRRALPHIRLVGEPAPAGDPHWIAQSDLLGSHRDAQHFVAEIDDDGRAHLRFGDDHCGEQPDAGMTFKATFRLGNGLSGNVGAEAISHLVMRNTQLSGVHLRARNPMPAQGGTVPEPVAEGKLFAPHQFRKTLRRAIIADDYAAIVEREFKDTVQRAVARLRWSGSWYEVLVAVDPLGRDEADPQLLDAITKRLHRYRRMGHDLVVKSARRVPLDIEMLVCVLPDYLRGHVKAALLDLFSNRTLPDGSKGFFHPDNLTFGEGIYLSRLVASAQAVEGVESVRLVRFQRLNGLANQELEDGVLPLGPFEIARLDNDPGFPENGTLILDVRGGR
ncbi:MAG: putative baseplate assembly protein [Desulfobacteraceae bacterium]|nr:putative baseplate assembly protein [Desulfobacteraceae bacterium]